ncbi:hypothetical protein C1H46_016148 [Malus baccata]|uniref:Uncharacterized protein n=1 Tax=Malus baccata TaxID=106549 RepID=A0A540MHK8_MALBA|nr:hypothetical protein C1H46_016148 [Malus baccata]
MSKSSSKPKHKSKSKSKSTTSSKGPLLFSDFGHKAKDFCVFRFLHRKKLFRGFSYNLPLLGSGRLAYSGIFQWPEVQFLIPHRWRSGTKFPSSTKTSASFSLPEYKSSKLRFQTRQEYGVAAVSVSLCQSPAINLSATVGSASIVIGMEAEYKTASSTFSKCNAGISMKSLNSDASIILGNKGGLVTASYVHYLDQEKKNAAVVKFTQNLSTKRSTLTVGGSCMVDHQTMVKARLDGSGDVKTLLQYSIRPKSRLSTSGEFNTKALDNNNINNNNKAFSH